MRYDAPQFAPTYAERVVQGRKSFVKKHRIAGLLAWPVSGVLILAHRVSMLFYRRAKKLSGVALIAAAFAVSSSFSFPVLKMSAGFISLDARRGDIAAEASGGESARLDETDEPGSEITLESVGESRVEFAEAAEADPTELLDASLLVDGYASEDISEVEIGDVYSVAEMLKLNDQAWAESDEAVAQSESGFDAADWRLILVNKQHPIPEDYQFELESFYDSMKCDKRIVGNLLEMFRAALDDGVALIPCSPFRTHAHQTELFDRKIDRYMAAGLSYMDAYTRASQAVTVPGTSEHEIGLAIDIVTDTYSQLDEGFGRTRAGKWLAKNSADYGFVLRYPEGKEDITGIEYEPWHFRYVGRDAAAVMTDEGICLEEFWDSYIYR